MRMGLSQEHNAQSLLSLVEKTPLLELDSRGKVVCTEKIDTPLDEFGIPRRVDLMRNVLNTLETAHIWTGNYDLHHVAWEGAKYRSIVVDDELIGSSYRGCSSLKVLLPRQLHNYIHAITMQPPIPPVDIMRQYALEHSAVNRLYDTVKISSYALYPDLDSLPESKKDSLRKEAYERKLSEMNDGEFGILPQIEYLSQLEVVDARAVLRGIARVQGLSNCRKSKKSFFSNSARA